MSRRGSTLLILALLLLALSVAGRRLSRWGDPPAFFVESPAQRYVALGEGFVSQGVHQFSDGLPGVRVTDLTNRLESPSEVPSRVVSGLPVSGRRYTLECPDEAACRMVEAWMNAEQRLVLGIPLHPDRMSQLDWEVLPGIGPKLAAAIETDRQFYGDFGSLEALERVKGIGPKRVAAWREYFSTPQDTEIKKENRRETKSVGFF